MKILLLGDGSNYHACLGRALVALGHKVVVASNGGGWMNTARSVNLERPIPGKLGGMLLFTKMMLDSRLKGYDIVTLINPSFVMLKPNRLKTVFNMLKKYNGTIFLSSIGDDKCFIDFILSENCPLRYSEYYSLNGEIYSPNYDTLLKKKLWLRDPLSGLCEFIYDNVKGVTTALYEYHMAMQNRFPKDMLAYAGIPVDFSSLGSYSGTLQKKDKVNLFLGRHSYRQKFKGTDRLEIAARRVAEEFPDKCNLEIIENLPYSDYLEKLKSADVVLDQIYSYTPATNALLAMAMGKAVVSGGEPEFYDFIGEDSLRPVINALPDDQILYETIKNLVLNPEKIKKASDEGPLFVKKHNDATIVAKRCLDFWTSKL